MKYIPFKTLLLRETTRFTSIWTQTILAPVISTSLYLLIFGVSLGDRIQTGTEFTYLEFIIPGLIMIGIVTNSSMNSTFSIFIAKLNGYIFDVLVAPLSYLELTLGYIIPGVLRGLIIGLIMYGVGFYFSSLIPFSIGIVLLVATLTGWCFAAIGAIIAIWAKDFDQLNIFQSFFLTPLIFLGGVFYSLDMLPPFWQKVAAYNPMLYMVDALRYGFLGISDINPLYSILFLFALAMTTTIALLLIFRSGWKLRS